MRITSNIEAVVIGVGIGLAFGLTGCASDPEPNQREGGGMIPAGASAAGMGGTVAAGSGTSGAGASGAGASGAGAAGAGGAGSSGAGATGASGAGSAGSSAGTSVAAGASGGSTQSGDVDCSQLELPENFDDVIATFEDGTGATNQVEGRGGGFFMYNDGTGTQEPPPGALPPARMESRCGGLYALCMSGSGFTDYGAGMGTDLGPTEGEMKMTFDASEYSGIAFWARIAEGTTPSVRVSIKDVNTAPEGGVCDENETSGDTACNDDWGKALNLSPEWTPYTIRFDELRQSGWGAAYDAFAQDAVYGIQWQVNANLEFDICIDDLVLVR